ncbi:hypothetical protein OUZ56_026007 [Daphnia magna]|uniref:Uncharacterized protein n=1 Tax=Daphnia magna TaxID=35525 RepID=A0ABQ9ZKL3_9CRUS|nr:hypothetical protein OUZ56_026007 [Daphnia magna]
MTVLGECLFLESGGGRYRGHARAAPPDPNNQIVDPPIPVPIPPVQPIPEPFSLNPAPNLPALQLVPPAAAPLLGPTPIKQKEPPVFHGTPEEDVVSWMFRFEQIADYNKWTPEQRLRIIGMRFEETKNGITD